MKIYDLAVTDSYRLREAELDVKRTERKYHEAQTIFFEHREKIIRLYAGEGCIMFDSMNRIAHTARFDENFKHLLVERDVTF